MGSMKILIANKFFFRSGGSETVMFQERDFLGTIGFEVVDFSMQDERNSDSPFADLFVARQSYAGNAGKFQMLKSAVKFVHSSEAVAKVSRLIELTRPELMHCHNIYHQLTPSIIGAAKRLGVPVVLTLHDFKPVCPTYLRLRHGKPCSACLGGDFAQVLRHRCAEGSFGKSALLFAEAVAQRWLANYEKVDLFLAPSRFMQQSVSGRFPAGKVTLLYNGVDTAALHGTGADDGYALYLGRLSPEKGVPTLLQARENAAGNWKLVVAGTGPLEADLRARYRDASFLGHVAGAALEDAINRASVIVVPSECYENCPMSVLEAMAYGKPVIGTRIGGIPELVADGETGLLFEPGDVVGLQACLEHLMGDARLRQRMGAAGRATAERTFSLDRHNAELLKHYQSVVR
jgi:glycosyltransferase involved in cell wall biosynthesis